jgi:hypothetical protein
MTIVYQAVKGSPLTAAEVDTNFSDLDTLTAKLAGAQTFTGEQTFKETVETVYNLTGTVIDPANGTIQWKILSANTTFTESLTTGQSLTLSIDDGTAYTITWPTITWIGGVAPVLPTTGWKVVTIWKTGATLYGQDRGNA